MVTATPDIQQSPLPKSDLMLKWRQRVGYWLYETGRFTSNLLIQTYLMIYMTDTARLSVAAVGTLFLVCKIIDAITDYIAGLLVDKTNSRFGKSRPWALLGIILVAVGLFTVFNIPSNFSSNSQLIYAYVTYSIFSLGMTFLNIPEFTILPTLSNDPEERTVLATCRQLSGNVINFFGTTVFAAMLVSFMEQGLQGYHQVAQIVAVFVLTCILVSLLLMKEVYVDNENTINAEEVQPKKNLLKASWLVLKNRRFWLFGLMASFISFAFMMTLMCGAYYFMNVMDNPVMQGTAMMCLSGAQFIGMFLTPMLGKKFSKRHLIMVGILMVYRTGPKAGQMVSADSV
ncbi:MFS transporter, partial [Streptococcus merionis]|uniref:MFS transporter n=1 Tax=Streptococcus merionis TaxID=400065 RepID=UPI0026EFABA5